MKIEQKQTMDLLDTSKQPALSTTSDMPVVETVPDAKKEGAPPEKPAVDVKAAPPAKDGKTNSESATEHTEESPGEPEEKKPPRGVQKRLDELTRQREEAKAQAEAERQEKLRILALLEKGPVREVEKPQPVESKDDVEPVRPKRSEFQDPDQYEAAVDEYIAAKSSFIARKEFREARAADKQEAEKKATEEAQQRLQKEHSARIEESRTKYSDYDQIMAETKVQVSIPVTNKIMTHKMGTELGYYLAKHPDEAARIFTLPLDEQLMEVGVILNGFKSQATVKADPAPEVKPSLTQAPKPIKPLGAGSETSGSKSLEEMSPEEYAAEWKKRPENTRRSGMRH